MTYRIIFHQGTDKDKTSTGKTDKDKTSTDDELPKSQRAMSILRQGHKPILKGWCEKPSAEEIQEAELVVYHDLDCGNQDPYIWNEHFLHSMCKFKNQSYNTVKKKYLNVFNNDNTRAITPDDVHFWCTSGVKKKISKADGLFCDVVFWVQDIVHWDKQSLPNCQALRDLGLVTTATPWDLLPTEENYCDNLSYWDHIFWASYDHHWQEGKEGGNLFNFRQTLVADPLRSFQPQQGPIARIRHSRLLVDLTDFLSRYGVYHDLQEALSADQWGIELPFHVGSSLYDYLASQRFLQISGATLQKWRKSIAQAGVYTDFPFRDPKKAHLPPFLLARIGDRYALKDWHGNLFTRRFFDIAIGPWTFRKTCVEGNWFFLGQEEPDGLWKIYFIEHDGEICTGIPPRKIHSTGPHGTKSGINTIFVKEKIIKK